MFANSKYWKFYLIITFAGVLTSTAYADTSHTEIYRITNGTERQVPSLSLQFAGEDSTIAVGLVLGVQHPLVNCTVGKTHREITYGNGTTEVFLTWAKGPLCAGGMLKVEVTSQQKAPQLLGGQWLEGTGAPIEELQPEHIFQGCDIVVWGAMNIQTNSLVAWISNTGTVDLPAVHCIVENDPTENANFRFTGKTVFESDAKPLPYHKSSGTICVLGPEERSSDYGAIRLKVQISDSDCEVSAAKLEAKFCVAWDGEGFEIVRCEHTH
jgi:hypothetical protein